MLPRQNGPGSRNQATVTETLMKATTFAMAVAVIIAPAVGFAHGQAPQAAHGGQVQEAHENWVELVVNTDQVMVYVLDEARKPIPASEVSGTATVAVGGKIFKVELVAAEGNSLRGKLPIPASGQTAATVSLKIAGNPASARFTIKR